MNRGKVIGDSRLLKGGGVTIPIKVREKLQVKDGDFLIYTETRNGNVIIKKAVFDIDETVKQIEHLRKKGLLLIRDDVDIKKSFENFLHNFADKND
jgi:bifunctional DNA-binding transcriptional regulator/antitoxin component of YhaV-PrlF toxin-antitoxin module